jgi:Acyl CoA:acetate/3-ketoacid CoA transferase
MEAFGKMTNFITADEAARLISDGASVGISAFGGWLGADELYGALCTRYELEGHPANLRLYGGILPGDLSAHPVGMNLLAKDGLVSLAVVAHVGMAPLFAGMIADGSIAAFTPPLGVFEQLLRASAGKRPGVISRIGLGTFCDPKLEGCRANAACDVTEELVRPINLYGRPYLFYKSFRLDVCLLRASYADEDGNLSAEREPVLADQLEMATAVHNNSGIVIAQVSRIVPRGTIHPKKVLVHGSMVDYIVTAKPENCLPGYDCPEFRPELVGDMRVATSGHFQAASLDPRRICARRAALELRAGHTVNLGIGIPDGVAAVAKEEGVSDRITLSLESGPLGGVPIGGVGFGAAVNPQAIYRLADTFDFYDGGGLNMAFLGAAEIDREGNVNVSKFGSRVTGPGGFINIAQSTPSVCFMGTFTAGGLQAVAVDGQLKINKEGRSRKFRRQVQQVTFSAKTAMETGQSVLYITERAVFRLTKNGPMLIETAPGVDIERDILAQMDFRPAVAQDLKEMDDRIFRSGKMDLVRQFGGHE